MYLPQGPLLNTGSDVQEAEVILSVLGGLRDASAMAVEILQLSDDLAKVVAGGIACTATSSATGVQGCYSSTSLRCKCWGCQKVLLLQPAWAHQGAMPQAQSRYAEEGNKVVHAF